MATEIHYVDNPGYLDLLIDGPHVFHVIYSTKMMQNYSFPIDFYRQIRAQYEINFREVLIIFNLATLFLLTRSAFKSFLHMVRSL